MAQIILDISANTHSNDEAYYKRMIDELAKVDTHKHEVILKWQLFEEAGDNLPADTRLFYKMADWARTTHGYITTASVFDLISLDDLVFIEILFENYKLPFIKIANRRDLDWLIGEIPRKYVVYKSVGTSKEYLHENETPLFCVSEYPAPISKYPARTTYLSDHTVGLELWHRNKPRIWEKHYKLPDSTGPDAGPFAITPSELKEIL